MKLSVIIPVYNEEKTILEVVRRVQKVQIEKEIVIVDDGSTDNTRDILKNLESEGIAIILHGKNSGKGSAIQTGLSNVSGKYVVIQDADLEYDPEEYHILLKPLEDGRASVVYGSRFAGSHTAFLFWHYLGNKFLTLVTNALYNASLTDMETCYKMMNREIMKGVDLRSKRFDCEPEMTAKILKRGYRIYEVPISYTGRDFSEGKKISWRDGTKALWVLIKYRFVN